MNEVVKELRLISDNHTAITHAVAELAKGIEIRGEISEQDKQRLESLERECYEMAYELNCVLSAM